MRWLGGWLYGFGLIEHVGRRSGQTYRTPVNVYPLQYEGRRGVAILLTFGARPNWLQNITAAHGGRMRHHGNWIEFDSPQPMPKAQAASFVTGIGRFVFPHMPFDDAVILTCPDAAQQSL